MSYFPPTKSETLAAYHASLAHLHHLICARDAIELAIQEAHAECSRLEKAVVD